MIHIVRKSIPRFTKSPSLVLIRLVLTEIQAFKNVKNLQRNVWKTGQFRLASSASGQDGALPARDYPLYPARKNFPERHIINSLLTKFVQSRWLDIGLVLFFVTLWTSTKHAKKELDQYLAILTLHLVNNPYLLTKIYTCTLYLWNDVLSDKS